MVFIMLLLVVDTIWKSFYFSRWYSAILTTAWLSMQIMAMVWEVKTVQATTQIPETLGDGKCAICELTSFHLQTLHQNSKTEVGFVGDCLSMKTHEVKVRATN